MDDSVLYPAIAAVASYLLLRFVPGLADKLGIKPQNPVPQPTPVEPAPVPLPTKPDAVPVPDPDANKITLRSIWERLRDGIGRDDVAWLIRNILYILPLVLPLIVAKVEEEDKQMKMQNKI